MEPFFDLEKKAPRLICPECGTCSISVFLRCDTSDWECLSVASCGECGRQFDAQVLPTYDERYALLRQRVAGEPCSSCGGKQRFVRSLCDRIQKRCYFIIGCGNCGDVRYG